MTLRKVASATHGQILRGCPDLELAGVSADSRTLRPGQLFFAIKGERFDAHDFLAEAARRGAAAVVLHKKDAAAAVPDLPAILVQDTTRAFGDLAHWHRKHTPITIVGVTGSNGKTTTKEMLFHILDGVVPCIRSHGTFNNAFGVPITLFQMRPEHTYAIVEMGTNSPGEIARLCEITDPDIGLLTNVSETHLEGLGSLEGIAREKAALLKHTARRGGAFYNADNYWSRRITRHVKGSLSSFGFENDATLRGFNLRSDASGFSFKVLAGPRIHVPVPGRHNATNALAAIAVARKLGIDWNTVADRLASFQLPPMRMERLTVRGVTLINDAYNANPDSMDAAARTLHLMEGAGRKILVLADMRELGPHAAEAHQRLGQTVAGLHFDYLLGLGPNTALLLAAAEQHGMSPHDLRHAASHDELARILRTVARPGDIVLFKGSRGMHLENTIQLFQQPGETGDRRQRSEAETCLSPVSSVSAKPARLLADMPLNDNNTARALPNAQTAPVVG